MEKLKFVALLSLEDSEFIPGLGWRDESLKVVNLSPRLPHPLGMAHPEMWRAEQGGH